MKKNELITRFIIDFSAAMIGLVTGMFYIEFFRDGLSFPLENSDGLVLISVIFAAILASSILGKLFYKSAQN